MGNWLNWGIFVNLKRVVHHLEVKRIWENGDIKWLKIKDYNDFDKVKNTEEKITEIWDCKIQQ